MNMVSLDSLTDTLRKYPILAASQLDEVKNTLAGQFPEPQALLQELRKRGWLTKFQAKQLLVGRGPQLVFGSYLVLDPLGGGGMGQVFRVRHMAMGRIVALKVLRKELVADEAAIGRFFREVEVISQLDHPNLVHAYDADVLNSIYFLALEYIDGVDLEKMVTEGGPLPIVQACDYIRQAALGLQYAHEKGLVHRDIKPANLLVAQAKSGDSRVISLTKTGTTRIGAAPWGVVKILDMGLARISQPPADSKTRNLTTLAGNQVMLGTPDYMAPEQAIDFHRADIRADVYSLGCSFFFLLAGKPPFHGGSAPMKLIRHQQADPPPIEQMRPEVPPELATVVMKMLVKKLPDRYQTPGEIAEVLAGLMQTPDLLPPAPAPMVPVKKTDGPSRSSSPSIGLPGAPKSSNSVKRLSSDKISLPPEAKASGTTAKRASSDKISLPPEAKPSGASAKRASSDKISLPPESNPEAAAKRASSDKINLPPESKPEAAATKRASSDKISLPPESKPAAAAKKRASSDKISLPPESETPAREETASSEDKSAPAETDGAGAKEDGDKPSAAPEKTKGKRKKSPRKWRHWQTLAAAGGATVLVGVALVVLTGGGDNQNPDAKATHPSHGSSVREQPNVAYLTELQERDVSVGYGKFGKHGMLGYPKDGRITVKGMVSAHGLSTHPPANGSAKVAYLLTKRFQTFSTKAALNDDVASSPAPLTFRVIGDGKELWKSKPITNRGDVQDCEISVYGIDRLELEVACAGEFSTAHAVWVDPLLRK
jgi:serine/threonine-protein kinase